MTLEPVCREVETAQGVPITVTGVAQVIDSKWLLSLSPYIFDENFILISFILRGMFLQVKLMSENEDILRMAAEQFLGKSVEEVQDTIIQVTSFF